MPPRGWKRSAYGLSGPLKMSAIQMWQASVLVFMPTAKPCLATHPRGANRAVDAVYGAAFDTGELFPLESEKISPLHFSPSF